MSSRYVSSRKPAEACQRNVVFMALSADTHPHFTTIAAFVRDLEKEIVSLFRDVLLYCNELGLIGREHFAIDGCKLPSNASKQWSGTHEELATKQKKLASYRAKIRKIKDFLSSAPKNNGPSGQENHLLEPMIEATHESSAWTASISLRCSPRGAQ